MGHVVLLGDSIFDNRAYIGAGEPDVVRQLGAGLGPDWRATLLAVDGSTTADLARQCRRLPGDATHLVVSCGGNDALRVSGFLDLPASSVAEVLAGLARLGRDFAVDYRRGLEAVLQRDLATALCTIYEPWFAEPERTLAATALASFNDAILRQAIRHGLPLVDLRLVCREAVDYANPIEPSRAGGAKIATALVRLLTEHDFRQRRTVIYV